MVPGSLYDAADAAKRLRQCRLMLNSVPAPLSWPYRCQNHTQAALKVLLFRRSPAPPVSVNQCSDVRGSHPVHRHLEWPCTYEHQPPPQTTTPPMRMPYATPRYSPFFRKQGSRLALSIANTNGRTLTNTNHPHK